jgi:hypothetical protein
MKRDPGETTPQRRKFLRDLATAGGLAALAGSTGSVVAAPAQAPAPAQAKPAGYRVTEHVAKYYQKARI